MTPSIEVREQWQATQRQNTQSRRLREFAVPFPPLPEQRAIATALSDVDALLGGLDRLIAKKRDLKQAAMQQLLTGQTRLPGFHGEWEVKRLGDIVEHVRAVERRCIESPSLRDGDITCDDRSGETALQHGRLRQSDHCEARELDDEHHRDQVRCCLVASSGPRCRLGKSPSAMTSAACTNQRLLRCFRLERRTGRSCSTTRSRATICADCRRSGQGSDGSTSRAVDVKQLRVTASDRPPNKPPSPPCSPTWTPSWRRWKRGATRPAPSSRP